MNSNNKSLRNPHQRTSNQRHRTTIHAHRRSQHIQVHPSISPHPLSQGPNSTIPSRAHRQLNQRHHHYNHRPHHNHRTNRTHTSPYPPHQQPPHYPHNPIPYGNVTRFPVHRPSQPVTQSKPSPNITSNITTTVTKP